MAVTTAKFDRGRERCIGLNAALPADAYVSGAFFDRECAELFPETWTFVGFAHELPRPGDVVPVTVGRQPILLVNKDGEGITAFHNVCRHRGAVLITEPANVGRFVRCPYHCWTYDLDGNLRRAPHFGGPNTEFPDGFSPADHGLHPVRCAVWRDWVFVNLSGDAPDFEAYIAPLQRRLEGIDIDAFSPVGSVDFGDVPVNWKFLMENFMEPYHVQFVHSTTTSQPLLDHSTFVDGICIGSVVDLGVSDGERTDRLAVSSRFLTLFPNFVLGWYEPDQLGVHLNVPLAPDRTRQRRVIYHCEGEGLPGDRVEALKALWCKVHGEDHAICERLQAGRDSPVTAAGGVLSPHWENGVRRFQELVANAVRPDQSANLHEEVK